MEFLKRREFTGQQPSTKFENSSILSNIEFHPRDPSLKSPLIVELIQEGEYGDRELQKVEIKREYVTNCGLFKLLADPVL